MGTTTQDINVVIAWLQSQNLPVLPVAPAQNPYQEGNYKVIKENPSLSIWRHCPLNHQLKPIPKYTGKNPSYLDPSGLCQLVNHKTYQNKLPSSLEVKLWFANKANGIGTLGGWNNTIWLDFDTKQFCDQESCDTAVLAVCESIKAQSGEEPFLERSHSGGWHIGIRVLAKPNFTNFALNSGGKHVGEALGDGRFVVLAPTIGPSGSCYESINRPDQLPTVESLESIGIYTTAKEANVKVSTINGETNAINQPNQRRIIVESYVPNAIPLESLGNDASRQILNGANLTGDRSECLTAAIKEWYGWENWARANNVVYSGTTQQLAEYAGGQLGIDSDRIGRILKTIDSTACHPAALSKGNEESCWKKIRRLSKEAFQSYCPPTIKSALKSLGQRPAPSYGVVNYQPKASGSSQGDNNQGNGGNGNGNGDAPPQGPQPEQPFDLVAHITKLLDQGLPDAELRQQLITLGQELGMYRGDIEAIAKEIQIQNDRTEDLEADSKQFQKLVGFRVQDLDLTKVFPQPLAQALLSKAESSRLDPIRLVQNLLPASGTMLGNNVQIIAKYGTTTQDHWYESPNFWCADVSPPSSGKSDAQRAMFSPLKYIEAQEYLRIEQAKRELARVEERWKLIPKEEKADLFGTEEDPEEFKKNNVDTVRRYLWDEVTTEALFKLISKQPRNAGSCLLKDELQGLFLGMDQFKSGRGNGIQQLLSAWSGPLTGSVDRVDETKSYRFNHQTLNICGSIQPEVARNTLNVSSDPDGFTSRMLFGMSKLPDNFTEWSDVQVDLFNCIKGLLEGLEQMSGTVEYSADGYRVAARQWSKLKKGYLHYLESNPAYAYFLGKQNSYIHRFALLLHCLEHYYDRKPDFYTVSVETLKKAIILSDYYCGQFRLLQAMSAKPDQPQLDGLLYRVWERVKSLGKFSTRELCHFARRQKWRGEKMTAAAALDILKTIANCGFGELKKKTLHWKPEEPPNPPTDPPTGSPPTPPDTPPTPTDEWRGTGRITSEELVMSPAKIDVMTQGEEESGQSGQMWSDCPQPELETEREVEENVDNCGQIQDTYLPTPVEETTEVVPITEEVVEDLTQNSALPTDEVGQIEEPLLETAQLPTEGVTEAVTEAPAQVATEQQTPEQSESTQQEIVVGSRVTWPKCPAHWEGWEPFVVEAIYENGMVKLEIVSANCLVSLSELILVQR